MRSFKHSNRESIRSSLTGGVRVQRQQRRAFLRRRLEKAPCPHDYRWHSGIFGGNAARIPARIVRLTRQIERLRLDHGIRRGKQPGDAVEREGVNIALWKMLVSTSTIMYLEVRVSDKFDFL